MDSKLIDLGCTVKYPSRFHLEDIKNNGFTIIKNYIENKWLLDLRDVFEYLIEKEGPKAGTEVHRVKGARRLADLVNKGKVFDKMYLDPMLLTTVYSVLQQPFKLSSLNGHEPEKCFGKQELHADWPKANDGSYYVVNSIWMLDDFSISNGATRVIPKSHKILGKVEDHIKDRLADHPDEVHIEGNAGDLIIFNGHLWHGCSTNKTGKHRRAFHCYFTSRNQPQQTDQRKFIREDTEKRLSPLAKYILDIE